MGYGKQKVLCISRLPKKIPGGNLYSPACSSKNDPHIVYHKPGQGFYVTNTFISSDGFELKEHQVPMIFNLDDFAIGSLIDMGVFEIPRSLAESNLSFQQIVVAGIVRQGAKILLLRNKKGDMKDAKDEVYTTVAGHCELFGDMDIRSSIFDVLTRNLKREFSEELGFDFKGMNFFENFFFNQMSIGTSVDTNFLHDIKVKYLGVAYNDYCDYNIEPDISYYHLGYIFDINLPEQINIENFYSNEPDKNDVVLVDLDNEDGDKYTKYEDVADKCDSWVKLILS